MRDIGLLDLERQTVHPSKVADDGPVDLEEEVGTNKWVVFDEV